MAAFRVYIIHFPMNCNNPGPNLMTIHKRLQSFEQHKTATGIPSMRWTVSEKPDIRPSAIMTLLIRALHLWWHHLSAAVHINYDVAVPWCRNLQQRNQPTIAIGATTTVRCSFCAVFFTALYKAPWNKKIKTNRSRTQSWEKIPRLWFTYNFKLHFS